MSDAAKSVTSNVCLKGVSRAFRRAPDLVPVTDGDTWRLQPGGNIQKPFFFATSQCDKIS
jgi:hypothetical protein